MRLAKEEEMRKQEEREKEAERQSERIVAQKNEFIGADER